MRYAFRAAVITGGEDLVVSHQDGSYLAPEASAASSDQKGHLHEVLLPTGSCVHVCLFVLYFMRVMRLLCECEPFLIWMVYTPEGRCDASKVTLCSPISYVRLAMVFTF